MNVDEKILRRSIRIFQVITVILLALGLAYASVYTIGAQEQAVVVTFGVPVTVSTPGLHFKLPFVQQKHIIPMVTRNLEIGYNSKDNSTVEYESLMITSDYNFVNVDFFLTYSVSDPIKYKYASDEPEEILRMMALSYIRDTIGLYPVDSVITTGRKEIEAEIEGKLSARLYKEDIGLMLVRIEMQDASPPTEEVFNAFKAVETAKQGKETAINNANKYRSEQEPAAAAQADSIQKKADAQKEARINEAVGQVARFDAMYQEYQKYPTITRQRMYYEAMEQILPELKVVIESEDSSSTSKMLPLEPFTSTITREGE